MPLFRGTDGFSPPNFQEIPRLRSREFDEVSAQLQFIKTSRPRSIRVPSPPNPNAVGLIFDE